MAWKASGSSSSQLSNSRGVGGADSSESPALIRPFPHHTSPLLRAVIPVQMLISRLNISRLLIVMSSLQIHEAHLLGLSQVL